MKILLDPVYTGLPSTCSTSYLMWGIIREFCKVRDDVFFYLLYSKEYAGNEEEIAFLNQLPERVTPIPITAHRSDRTAELYTLNMDIRNILNPIGSEYWDFDYVFSSRIPQIPMYKALSGREGGSPTGSARGFFGLEEMPVLSFRDTVPWHNRMELSTLASYAKLDGVLINNQWTLDLLRKVLKPVFSPSYQKAILDNVHEVVPVKLERLHLKKDFFKDGKDINVVFTGRMTHTRNFEKVFSVFRRQFSFPIGKGKKNLKFLVSTNTRGGKTSFEELDIDFVDVQKNDRAEFHAFLKAAHLAINLSRVEDFSLSTYETLMAGVPTIVLNKPWSFFLGESYPFRVENEVQAYAMVTEFAKDYEGMYKKFEEWEQGYWAGYVGSDLNITTSEVILSLVQSFEDRMSKYYKDSGVGGTYLELADSLTASDMKEVVIQEEMKKKGWLIGIPFATIMLAPQPLTLKHLLSLRGWRDTNQPGVMVR